MTKIQGKRRRIQRKRQNRRSMAIGGIGVCLVVLFALLISCRREPETETSEQTNAETAEPFTESQTCEASSDETIQEDWEIRQTTDADLAQGTLILVNRDYAYDARASMTVSVYENKSSCYLVKDIYLGIRSDAMAALNEWMEAFAAESGKTDVNIVAGWRSYDDQVWLYQNAVDTKGQAHADAYLALPGHSEHHTGLAIDLDTYDVDSGTSGGFDGDGDYLWAVEHAWEFGFIQRYPPQKSAITGINYESWHFRYVGLPHAYVMKTHNLCLEEYIDDLRNYPFSGDHLRVTCLDRNYEIYFCPKEQLVVPATGNYTVSGNNVDGFVVTIEIP